MLIRAEAMTCQSTPEMDSSGYIRLLWESDDDRNGHAAIFEVKFGKRQKEQPQNRASDRLGSSLTFWSLLL